MSITLPFPAPAVGRILDGRIDVHSLAAPPLATAPAETSFFTGTAHFTGLGIHRTITHEGSRHAITWTASTTQTLPGVSLRQSINLDLPSTSYVLAPGVIYAGNRFLCSPQPYCPHIPAEGVSPAGPVLIADVPRLTAETGYTVELAADALTTPFVGLYDPATRRGALVRLPIYGDWGVTGVTLRTLPGKPVEVILTFPVQRLRRYRFCDWVATEEPGLTLQVGTEFRVSFEVIEVTAPAIPAFVGELSRRAFAARDHGGGPVRHNPLPALRTAADLVEAKYDRLNWDEANGFYCTAPVAMRSANPIYLLQSGWSGGGPMAVAMLQSAYPTRRARARRMLDFLCTGQAASGFFHGGYGAGFEHGAARWLSFDLKRPGCRAFTFVRRTLECGRDLLKSIDLVEARGETVNPQWAATARRFLDAVVTTTARHGHLGYSINPDTGEVLWGPSTASDFALEALVRGHRRFGRPEYLATAVRLAAFCREDSLAQGLTYGGVGDALMAADSESAYALVAGLVHLHQATGEAEHLAWAVEAADVFQTWVLLYDTRFPANSTLARAGVDPRGAVLANVPNQHGAPGIYQASGAELLTLSRLTGDDRYRLLLREIVACLPGMVVREETREAWGGWEVGEVTERLMTMDGIRPCGETDRTDSFGPVTIISANELPPDAFE
jgi:hypothetical protein